MIILDNKIYNTINTLTRTRISTFENLSVPTNKTVNDSNDNDINIRIRFDDDNDHCYF